MQAYIIGAPAKAVSLEPENGMLSQDGMPHACISFRGQSNSEGATLRILAMVYFCEDKSVCQFQQVVFDVPLLVPGPEPVAPASVKLQYAISPKAGVVDFPFHS